MTSRPSRHMRRRLARPLPAALLLLVLSAALLALAACSPQHTEKDAALSYTMELDFDGEREIDLLQEVTVPSSRLLCSELAFHLYPNAFSETSFTPICPAEEKEEIYYNGESFGEIEILSVETCEKTSNYEISEDGCILRVPCPDAAEDTVTVALRARLLLPECNARFGVSEDGVHLTGFYPVLCMAEDGEWRTEGYSPFGDPFFSESADYSVTLRAPEGYVVASSGEILSSEVKGGVRTTYAEAGRVRDFALFLSRDFKTEHTTAETNGREVEVRYFFTDDPDPRATALLAARAVTRFSSLFGAYPYPVFSVVQADTGAGGMEFGSLVAVTPDASRENYAFTVVHETAHQWWFGIVGSDQLNEPWLDEGLTEFSAAYFFLLEGEPERYRDTVLAATAHYSRFAALPDEVGFSGKMSRPLSSYVSAGEYVAVTYSKGLLLFDTLFTLAGEKTFIAALADYCRTHAYDTANADDLAAAFLSQGFDASGVMNAFINDTALIR